MHILYIHQYFCPPGGSGNTRSLDFARAWVQQGHRVTILTTPAYFPVKMLKDSPSWRFTLCPGLEIVVLNVAYSHMMPFSKRVLAFVKFYRRALAAGSSLSMPDVIYASSTPPTVGEIGRKLARKWDIPYLFEVVDVWPDVPAGMGILKSRLLLNWINRRLDKIYAEANEIIALSDGMKEQILSHGVDGARVHVIPNGTNPDQFPFLERPLHRNPIICIYTGTIGLANDVSAILKAAKVLHDRGRHDILFRIVGGGNDFQRVEALSKEMDLSTVTLSATVPKEEVSRILESADIGLVTFAAFPVLEANSANKWFDYLASGLPVVTNYKGWQAKVMEDQVCGFSAKQGDVQEFAEKIEALADDPAMRARMGRNGADWVRKAYDRNQLATRVLQLMKKAALGAASSE